MCYEKKPKYSKKEAVAVAIVSSSFIGLLVGLLRIELGIFAGLAWFVILINALLRGK